MDDLQQLHEEENDLSPSPIAVKEERKSKRESKKKSTRESKAGAHKEKRSSKEAAENSLTTGDLSSSIGSNGMPEFKFRNQSYRDSKGRPITEEEYYRHLVDKNMEDLPENNCLSENGMSPEKRMTKQGVDDNTNHGKSMKVSGPN